MLLAAPDQNVVLAALSALVAFVRKTHVTSIRWQGFPELNAKLLALAKGWGGREQVGQASCMHHSCASTALSKDAWAVLLSRQSPCNMPLLATACSDGGPARLGTLQLPLTAGLLLCRA